VVFYLHIFAIIPLLVVVQMALFLHKRVERGEINVGEIGVVWSVCGSPPPHTHTLEE